MFGWGFDFREEVSNKVKVRPSSDILRIEGLTFCSIGMRKLSKVIYNNNIGDRHAVKALALFVFVKENKPTSVFMDYTITALAKFASLSRNTTRNRIKKLEEMGLVERV